MLLKIFKLFSLLLYAIFILNINATSTERGIRIYFHYSDKFNELEFSQILKSEVFDKVRNNFHNILFPIHRTKGPLLIDRACVDNELYYNNTLSSNICTKSCERVHRCLGVEIPSYLHKGCYARSSNGTIVLDMPPSAHYLSNTDLVVIVTTKSCQRRIASAAACSLDSLSKRPVLGVLFLCDGKMKGRSIKSAINVVTHELIHILAFAESLFPFYQLPSDFNRKEIVRDIVRNISTPNGPMNETISVLMLPTVLEEAKRHFNCSDIDGVDMDGDVNSKFTAHFSDALFHDELMTSFFNDQNIVISRLTLAVLKDSGWYNVNISVAGHLHYGRNLGCTFVKNGCYAHIQEMIKRNKSTEPFCHVMINNATHHCSSKLRKPGRLSFTAIVKSIFYRLFGWQETKTVEDYSRFCPILMRKSSSEVVGKMSILLISMTQLFSILIYTFTT